MAFAERAIKRIIVRGLVMKYHHLLPFWQNKLSYYTMSIVIVLTFFATMAGAVFLKSIHDYVDWQNALHNRGIIVASGADSGQKLLLALKTNPHILDLELLSPDDINKLMAPWLGIDGAGDLNTPTMLMVQLKDSADLLQFQVIVEQIDNGAVYRNNLPIENATNGAQLAILITGLLGLGLAMVAVVLVGRMASEYLVKMHEPTIVIIHLLGLPDGQLIKIFTDFGRIITLISGISGALLAMIMMVIVESLQINNQLLQISSELLRLELLAPIAIFLAVYGVMMRQIRHAIMEYTK